MNRSQQVKLNSKLILLLFLFLISLIGTLISQHEKLENLEQKQQSLNIEISRLKQKEVEPKEEIEPEEEEPKSEDSELTPQELMNLAAENPNSSIETPSRGDNRIATGEVVRARVTAYAPLDNQSGICAQGDPNVTATGTQSRRGVIAVDPKKIPYGSKVYIPGYGEALAEDTGGAIRSYDGIAIDILVDSYEEAMQWGKQYIDITIIERGE